VVDRRWIALVEVVLECEAVGFVGEAACALQAPFDDVFIRHYDIQFTFDGDELFEAETCRRFLLTDALVDKYATELEFSLSQLRDAILAADDIDDESAPVAWGECRDYSQTDDAVIILGGAAAAAGASGSARHRIDTGIASWSRSKVAIRSVGSAVARVVSTTHEYGRGIESILSATILVLGFSFVALGSDIPWPLVIELAGVGIWTLALPIGLLATLVVARLSTTERSNRYTQAIFTVSIITVLASVYAVVGPYIDRGNPLLSVFPASVLGLILASAVVFNRR
jgi:hypothetical protein